MQSLMAFTVDQDDQPVFAAMLALWQLRADACPAVYNTQPKQHCSLADPSAD